MDVLPVALFLFFFHAVVLKRKLVNRNRIIVGFCLVVLGLGFFLVGLERGLFPLGRLMAEQLTSVSMEQATGTRVYWSDYYWVYIFAFAVGFGTTIAEPALLAVAIKANAVSGGAVHTWGLRIAVALGVAVGVSLGCFRIVTGTPLHWYIIVGYLVVVVQTAFSPKLIVPLAYDSGGVTTSGLHLCVRCRLRHHGCRTGVTRGCNQSQCSVRRRRAYLGTANRRRPRRCGGRVARLFSNRDRHAAALVHYCWLPCCCRPDRIFTQTDRAACV